MDSNDHHHGHPGLLFAGLVGLGLLGGHRVLRRLRRLSGLGVLWCLGLAPVSGIILGAAGGGDAALVYALIFFCCAWLLFLCWCAISFAAWLTSPDPAE